MMNSVILSNDGFYLRHLAMFLSPVIGDDSRWELCYRSSTHGDSDYKFHSNCDGKSNTVTIVKKNDFVFGGFTDIPWGRYSTFSYFQITVYVTAINFVQLFYCIYAILKDFGASKQQSYSLPEEQQHIR